MNTSVRKGISFGLVSGVITTLGLLVGLDASTKSSLAVLGGVIVIAFADALSDALGIHMSEEANIKNSTKKVWQATISTFFSKFVIALTFIIPLLLFSLSQAVIISIVWGVLLVALLSYYIAKKRNERPSHTITEHVVITVVVIVVTWLIGKGVAYVFA